MQTRPRLLAGVAGALALVVTGLPCSFVLGQEQAASPSPATATSRKVTSPGNAVWAQDDADARVRASTEKKLVYDEFVSSDCAGCSRMQTLLYPAFDFEALLIGMVPVQIDLGSAEGKKLGERYGITSAPAILITNPAGRLVFLMQGFGDTQDFYAHAHSDLDAYRQFSKMIDGQNVSTLSAEEAYSTGRILYDRFDFEAAAARLRRASTDPGAKPALRASALEGLAAAELELGNTSASRRAIDKLVSMATDPGQKERAELFRAQIWLAEDKPAEALKAYKKFEKDYPDSAYIEKVKSFISRLESPQPKP
jgi:tetratricopeptide (TPR) repeat protein